MRIFETYRNLIDKLDLDDQRYLKISKIEAIFETSEIFFFSLFDHPDLIYTSQYC